MLFVGWLVTLPNTYLHTFILFFFLPLEQESVGSSAIAIVHLGALSLPSLGGHNEVKTIVI